MLGGVERTSAWSTRFRRAPDPSLQQPEQLHLHRDGISPTCPEQVPPRPAPRVRLRCARRARALLVRTARSPSGSRESRRGRRPRMLSRRVQRSWISLGATPCRCRSRRGSHLAMPAGALVSATSSSAITGEAPIKPCRAAAPCRSLRRAAVASIARCTVTPPLHARRIDHEVDGSGAHRRDRQRHAACAVSMIIARPASVACQSTCEAIVARMRRSLITRSTECARSSCSPRSALSACSALHPLRQDRAVAPCPPRSSSTQHLACSVTATTCRAPGTAAPARTVPTRLRSDAASVRLDHTLAIDSPMPLPWAWARRKSKRLLHLTCVMPGRSPSTVSDASRARPFARARCAGQQPPLPLPLACAQVFIPVATISASRAHAAVGADRAAPSAAFSASCAGDRAL